MMNEHKFDNNRVCIHCGLSVFETRKLRSYFCGMMDCTKEEYEEAQIDRLISNLRDLGEPYVVRYHNQYRQSRYHYHRVRRL